MKHYDQEEAIRWCIRFYSAEDTRDNGSTAWMDGEPTPEWAAELAKKNGYDVFEIVQEHEIIKRYNVGGDEE